MHSDTLELLESGQQLRVLLMQLLHFPLKADHVLPLPAHATHRLYIAYHVTIVMERRYIYIMTR